MPRKPLIVAAVASLALAAGASSAAAQNFVYMDRGADSTEVFRSNINGTGAVQLTKNTGGDCDPQLSPDGKKIAWVHTGPDGDVSELWVMNIDGTSPQQLTSNPVGREEFIRMPTWSPDGLTIAFHRSEGFRGTGQGSDDFDLHAVTLVPGSTERPVERELQNLPGYEFEADFSPDGKRIAFTYDADGAGSGTGVLSVMDVGVAGSAQQLTKPDVVATGSASWSPDGKRIAFDRSYIYVVDVATKVETKLTKSTGSSPSWSAAYPNEIAFTALKGSAREIWKYNLVTKATTQLTFSKGFIQQPNWL
jgi:Tol biopolymer transport system component